MDVKTRWSSTYEMMARLLDLEDFIKTYYSEEEDLTAAAIDKAFTMYEELREVVALCRPWNIITVKLQQEDLGMCQAMNLITKEFRRIDKLVSGVEPLTLLETDLAPRLFEDLSPTAQECARNIQKCVYERFIYHPTSNITPDHFLVAILLDPRMGRLVLERMDTIRVEKGAPGDLHSKAKNAVTAACEKASQRPITPAVPAAIPVEDYDDVYDSADDLSNPQIPSQPRSVVSELMAFSSVPNAFMPQADPKSYPGLLQWWQKNEDTFPHLSKVAKAYLAIRPTSVASERLFSLGGNIMTEKRTRMSAQRLEMTALIKANQDVFPQEVNVMTEEESLRCYPELFPSSGNQADTVT